MAVAHVSTSTRPFPLPPPLPVAPLPLLLPGIEGKVSAPDGLLAPLLGGLWCEAEGS